ncbi:MAG: hypothetical protein NWF00_12545 [Candidatus Bathyarchaeota archaeon]|nr:hypothetical protein [Candidatus Bathyarchaeota archaeon]
MVQADPDVNVTFAVNGVSNYSGTLITVDGVQYDLWNMPTFQWAPGSTHTVSASTPVTGWDSTVYRFSSWTNGNGLTDASGTFTTPSSDVTVTANYVLASVTVTFESTGVSDYNGVVLTIDGTGYDWWNLPSFTWETDTTHTVTASTPITGWDSVTHYFSSWTNGNGLTGASGTFTVPASDTTVTANYDTTPPAAETSLTINCIPTTVDKTGTATTSITGTLTSSGSGVADKSIVISYFDGLSWTQIDTATTAAGTGVYQYSWDVPAALANGEYVLKAVFAGDSSYEESTATTGMVGNGGNLFVVPEYLWGGLAALGACFAALIVFKNRGSLQRKNIPA